MNTTNLSNAAFKSVSNYAWPHSKLDGRLQVIDFINLDNAGPAGSINSSVAGMAKWVALQLNRGKLPNSDARLFSERQSREMWSAQTILPAGERPGPLVALSSKFASYALGWGLRGYHGRKLVGHTRGRAAFVSPRMLLAAENHPPPPWS